MTSLLETQNPWQTFMLHVGEEEMREERNKWGRFRMGWFFSSEEKLKNVEEGKHNV